VYNTIGGAPLASQEEEPRHGHDEQHEDPELLLQDQQQGQRTAQPDHPEVPLFLARGLGIDRIASGFFTAGKSTAAGCKGETMGGGGAAGAGRGGGRAGRAVQADGGRAARQRAVPAQLRAVPARGTPPPPVGATPVAACVSPLCPSTAYDMSNVVR